MLQIHRLKDTYLKKIQTLFKTDARYLLRGGLYLSIGQSFAALSGFILTVCLVRILDQAQYGLYAYILSFAGAIGVFTHSGMDTAVTQAVAKGFDRSVIDGFWEKLKWSMPIAIVTLCVSGYYFYKDDATLGFSILIAGVTIPFFAASSLYVSYLNGKKQFKRLVHDNIFRNGAITVSILLTAYLTHNIIYTVFAYFISNTLISVTRFLVLSRKIPDSEHETKEQTLHIGKHQSFMEILGNISAYFDKIIVFQLLGATPLALYALAMAPVKQMSGVTRIIRALALPKFSTRSAKELKGLMKYKMFILFCALLSITISYCVFAQFFFVKIFPQYEEAVLYSQVLSLGLLFLPSVLHLEALTALKMKRELYIVYTSKSVIRILLLIILVPFYGIWGAIFTFLLTQLSLSILLKVLFERIKTP
jgi:O-antigen/teichoic acid export membrane protein